MNNSTRVAATLINAGLRTWLEELKEKPDARAILRRAFEMSFDDSYSWMVSTNEERFNAAITAAHTKLEEVDKKTLERELKALQVISATLSGVPVDLEAALPGDEERESLRALMLFDEVKKEKSMDIPRRFAGGKEEQT